MNNEKEGDCWIKDKVLLGNEATKDGVLPTYGLVCTTHFKSSGGI